MVTKIIKFDLQMKGVKIKSFEELQKNFSADILPIFQAGRLAKWLMSRELVTLAEAIAVIDKSSTELQQLAAICRVLELDADEDILQFLLDDRQAAQTAEIAASIPTAAVSDVAAENPFPLLSGVDWRGQDLSRRQFIGGDLRNANLENTNFSNADLSRADLSGADFSRSDLSGADLSGANLSGATLWMSNLTNANLTDTNLTSADLTFAKIQGSNFTGANLTNADLSCVTSHDVKVFRRSRSNYAILKYKIAINSGSANFSCSNLTNAKISASILVSDNFTDANLTKANLEYSVLVDSNFSGANLTQANLHEVVLHNANFTKANLSFASLNGAGFDMVDENGKSLGEKVNLTSVASWGN